MESFDRNSDMNGSSAQSAGSDGRVSASDVASFDSQKYSVVGSCGCTDVGVGGPWIGVGGAAAVAWSCVRSP